MNVLDILFGQTAMRTEADESFRLLERAILPTLQGVPLPAETETLYGPHCANVPSCSPPPPFTGSERGSSSNIGGGIVTRRRRIDWTKVTFHDRQNQRVAYRVGACIGDTNPLINAAYLIRSNVSGPPQEVFARPPWTLFIRDCAEGSKTVLGRARLQQLIPNDDEELGANPAALHEMLGRLVGEERKLQLSDPLARLMARTMARAFAEACQSQP